MTSPSFPAALDALANPGPTTETDDAGYELDIVIARLQNCVMAIEHKLGIGAGDPPGTAAVLRRTATGSSAWGQLAGADVADGAVPQLIATSGVLPSPASSIVFGSPTPITQAYKHLELRIYGRMTGGVTHSSVKVVVNNSTAALYHGEGIQVNAAGLNAFEHGPGLVYAAPVNVPGASATAGCFGSALIAIPGYSGTGGFRHMTAHSHYTTAGTAGNAWMIVTGMTYYDTAAVTRLDLTPLSGSWAAGTIVSLYGLN